MLLAAHATSPNTWNTAYNRYSPILRSYNSNNESSTKFSNGTSLVVMCPLSLSLGVSTLVILSHLCMFVWSFFLPSSLVCSLLVLLLSRSRSHSHSHSLTRPSSRQVHGAGALGPFVKTPRGRRPPAGGGNRQQHLMRSLLPRSVSVFVAIPTIT